MRPFFILRNIKICNLIFIGLKTKNKVRTDWLDLIGMLLVNVKKVLSMIRKLFCTITAMK